MDRKDELLKHMTSKCAFLEDRNDKLFDEIEKLRKEKLALEEDIGKREVDDYVGQQSNADYIERTNRIIENNKQVNGELREENAELKKKLEYYNQAAKSGNLYVVDVQPPTCSLRPVNFPEEKTDHE